MAQKRLRYGEPEVVVMYQGETQNPNVVYETGIDVDGILLVKDGSKKTIYAYEMNIDVVKKKAKGKRLSVDVLNKKTWKSIGEMIKNRVVGIDMEHSSASFLKWIMKHTKRIADISHEYCIKRSKKSGKEVRNIKRAAKETLDIIHSIDLTTLKTEKDVEKALLIETIERGFSPAFHPIVSTGKNTRFPHYKASRKRLEDLVLIDYGVKVNGYCGDITEMFFLSKKSKQYETYEKVVEAFYSIVDGLGEAKSGGDIHNIYEKVFDKIGLPKMPHAIGHGIGLEVHECPSLSKNSSDSLKRATIAIEPAFYGSSFGIRFERDIFLP